WGPPGGRAGDDTAPPRRGPPAGSFKGRRPCYVSGGGSTPLASLLTLAVTALLCSSRSLYAIAQFGRGPNHPPARLPPPRPRRHTLARPPASASGTPSSPPSTMTPSRRR